MHISNCKKLSTTKLYRTLSRSTLHVIHFKRMFNVFLNKHTSASVMMFPEADHVKTSI